MDRMTVVGRDGTPRYLIENDDVQDLTHVHKIVMVDGQLKCEICNQPIEGDTCGDESKTSSL